MLYSWCVVDRALCHVRTSRGGRKWLAKSIHKLQLQLDCVIWKPLDLTLTWSDSASWLTLKIGLTYGDCHSKSSLQFYTHGPELCCIDLSDTNISCLPSLLLNQSIEMGMTWLGCIMIWLDLSLSYFISSLLLGEIIVSSTSTAW